MIYASASALESHNSNFSLFFNEVYSVSIIDTVFQNNDGSYNVSFSVYSSYDPLSKDYYGFSKEEADNNDSLNFVYEGDALIKDYYKDGINKYQLISYNSYLGDD